MADIGAHTATDGRTLTSMMCHQFSIGALENQLAPDPVALWCGGQACGLALSPMVTLIPNLLRGVRALRVWQFARDAIMRHENQ